MTIHYGRAFSHLVPSARWSCAGDDNVYANYVWHDDRPQPSKQACDDAWQDVLDAEADEQARVARQAAFRAEADPIYFKWQRDEAAKQDWLDKVDEIRGRFPYAGEAD